MDMFLNIIANIVTNINQPIATIIAAAITAGAAWYISNNYFKNKLYDKKVDALVEIVAGVNKYMKDQRTIFSWEPQEDDWQLRTNHERMMDYLLHTQDRALIINDRCRRYAAASETLWHIRTLMTFWFPELLPDLEKLVEEISKMRDNILSLVASDTTCFEMTENAMSYPYKGYDTIALYDNLIDRLRHHLPK